MAVVQDLGLDVSEIDSDIVPIQTAASQHRNLTWNCLRLALPLARF